MVVWFRPTREAEPGAAAWLHTRMQYSDTTDRLAQVLETPSVENIRSGSNPHVL